jgi:ADP-ribose pyrophosphatase YjhB (NUDIX family)
MEIYTNEYIEPRTGKKYLFEYQNADSFEHLPQDSLSQVYAVAFYGGKMILVNDKTRPKEFLIIGGGVEKGENPDDTLKRELKEEGNYKVISFKPIGYQAVVDTSGEEKTYYQLRYFAIVEPYGPFVSDPDGDVTEVIEIDPKDYKKHFDWGETGDVIMERALNFLKEI